MQTSWFYGDLVRLKVGTYMYIAVHNISDPEHKYALCSLPIAFCIVSHPLRVAYLFYYFYQIMMLWYTHSTSMHPFPRRNAKGKLQSLKMS